MRLVFPSFMAPTTIPRRTQEQDNFDPHHLLPSVSPPPSGPPYNTSRGRGSHDNMEADDETTRTNSQMQMLNNNSIASLLYCDEDPLVPTTPVARAADGDHGRSCDDVLRPAASSQQQQQSSSVLATVVGDVEEDHLKELLVDHMARQRFYAPTKGYLEHLSSLTTPPPQQQPQQGSSTPTEAAAIISPGTGSISGARSTGVHYIIYAFGRLGLTVGTLFNAVNYLDRFLSINCHLWWEAWMVELVSVACLSLACKLDEVNIPSLHHLQMEEVMSHSFLSATIQDMELTLLKALQWRLACVTPYSFLNLLLPLFTPPPPTTATVASRCTRLLICSLTEPSFIQFDPSVIASSALGCVLAALLLGDHHQTYGYISRLIPPDCPAATAMVKAAADADECFRMMETLYASCCCSESADWNTHHHQPLYSNSSDEWRLWSPVSVIGRPCLELETPNGGGRLINNSRSAVRRRRLFGSSAPSPQGSGTQLQDDDDDNTHVRDEDISHTHN